jgi:hypothetical protein
MMRTIHALQDCQVTILIADDNGSGKLVQWYQQAEQGSFQIVPAYLQDFLGNSNQQYGVAMMALTPTVVLTSMTTTTNMTTTDNNLPRIEWW